MTKGWRFQGNELKYIKEVLDNGFRAGVDGAMTERAEALFAEKFNLPYAIAFNSGSRPGRPEGYSTERSCCLPAPVFIASEPKGGDA